LFNLGVPHTIPQPPIQSPAAHDTRNYSTLTVALRKDAQFKPITLKALPGVGMAESLRANRGGGGVTGVQRKQVIQDIGKVGKLSVDGG
jgi:hypothetical protein